MSNCYSKLDDALFTAMDSGLRSNDKRGNEQQTLKVCHIMPPTAMDTYPNLPRRCAVISKNLH